MESSDVRAKYTHTNLVARDWRKLARFYETVFGCKPVPPGRDLHGEELARGSGVPVASRPGSGHLAFEVADVPAAEKAVLAAGGSKLGEIVTFEVPGVGCITWTYIRDPEDNIIELQSWS